ncbi:MAG: RNase adapter RapZ [Pseudomonadota bacterium]|nr:RNase adapter RapZ [Pseudomonadota bacterium]
MISERKNKILIVTGLSGAGRSTALKILEDMGFEAIDNLPTYLLEEVINSKIKKNLAVGVDIRTRDFDAKKIAKQILEKKKKKDISLLFFDCDNTNLLNRFKENRRVHPLKLDLPMTDIIDKERIWLKPLINITDFYIDTSGLNVNILKNQMHALFNRISNLKTSVRIISFGYKYGLPREADLVFDMRFLKNPFYEKRLANLNGKNPKVIDFVKKQEYFNFFFDKITVFFNRILGGYKEEGKDYITVAFGCTGGVHRSVVSSECFYSFLKKNKELKVYVDHRDLKK